MNTGSKANRSNNRLLTTDLGAAYLARLTVDYWKDLNELKVLVSESESFQPNRIPKERDKKLSGWHNALKTVRYYSQLNLD